ncbi:hypothetical protein ACWGRK_18555 [Saccharomonospora azurea]|uniref:PE domain-containing protein n=1 Tax=Saccharomonospora azurea NA-128 TaxID=882081 RepID=H8GA48_9PSEU|nr:hypothetical protein [Saccharomonospora azurea]EHK88320.1 hypothetical protein SZMC14600_05686 [Saccharomonospora azurea SZMC 14600]EHY88575.1 hypothetical protein SacazDRAFT_01651 [Saccharomonospora azurea NA-128]
MNVNDDGDQAMVFTRTLSGLELKRMATGQGFSVDDTTGERMIRALQDMVDLLEERWSTLEKLATNPPLSVSATAQWTAQRTVATASDEYGLLTQLRAARDELPQYIEAIRAAKRGYSETEAAHQKSIEGLSPS